MACEPCPDGAVCLGGRRAPYPKSGYWGDPLHPVLFDKCKVGYCAGGEHFGCKEGRAGRMCKLCAEGYFSVAGECRTCPDGALGTLAEVRKTDRYINIARVVKWKAGS